MTTTHKNSIINKYRHKEEEEIDGHQITREGNKRKGKEQQQQKKTTKGSPNN